MNTSLYYMMANALVLTIPLYRIFLLYICIEECYYYSNMGNSTPSSPPSSSFPPQTEGHVLLFLIDVVLSCLWGGGVDSRPSNLLGVAESR